MKPAFQQNRVTIFNADVLDCLRTFPMNLVQCVVTSPPYWGLRDYGITGQLGLETTPEEYLQRMVEVFREVRRVLRSDGTLWLNMGDSYMGSGHGWSVNPTDKQLTQKYWRDKKTKDKYEKPVNYISSPQQNGFKPKDLAGMPWRLALALQADGWYLRSDIIWHKPNPMPESVTDRPTKAHEYIFLLAKSERYFYDAEAIREKCDAPPVTERRSGIRSSDLETYGLTRGTSNPSCSNPSGRNKRTVWTVPTEPFPEAHFATFPTELIKPCILAGTSERGACSLCGAPWQRVVQSETHNESGSGRSGKLPNGKKAGGTQVRLGNDKTSRCHDIRMGPCVETRTIGWKPACECEGVADGPHEPKQRSTKPCIVLDPFMGSGTVAEVARMNGCEAYGIELNPEYVEIASRRLRQDILAFS